MASRIGAVADRWLSDFVLEAGYDRAGSIPPEMTFRAWCEELGAKGLKVDGHPFTLADRPAMAWIYDLIPTTVEAAKGRTVVMMKCAQVGFTVMEMLATIYLALKFEPCKIGMYLPDMKLAGLKSTVRYMPILRLVPDAYARLTEHEASTGRRGAGEGNVMSRQLGGSLVLFLWTSGKAMTESMPQDVLSFDEVQEMTIESMEKTAERLSASSIKFKLMGSTANWPDADIHYWFKRGTQHRFRTHCRACGEWLVMDDHFPGGEDKPCCIGYDDALRDWRYVCVHCGAWLPDTQDGEWVADNPGAVDEQGRGIVSCHFPQFLSPTITAREMMESYNSADDLKNYFNRKLGKPFTDPAQVPVTLEHLRACSAAGVAAGLVWKKSARQCFMGIDNMGGYSCAVVLERLPNGIMALVHAEQVHALDPWKRLDELMRDYGVVVAVCEQLPNYDSAKQFASRHPGRVFLVAAYKDLPDNMLQWGDATQSKADKKTASEHRDRYTVTLDQYKMMDWSFARITGRTLYFPDPRLLTQEIVSKGIKRTVCLLKDVLWDHFTKTALVTEKDPEKHIMRRSVKKIGLDPHFSFSLMMACAAWCRSYGTGSFIMPETAQEAAVGVRAAQSMPGLPASVVGAMSELPPSVCGRCSSFEVSETGRGRCLERGFAVGETDPSCPVYSPKG